MDLRQGVLILGRYLESEGYKPETRRSYIRDAVVFCNYLKEEEVIDLRDVETRHVESFHHMLLTLTGRTGNPLASHTVAIKIRVVRLLFEVLFIEGRILKSPAEGFKVKETRDTIRPIFSREEIEAFLSVFDGEDYKSLRDRAAFELLYSSGLRISELQNLKKEWVDLTGGYVSVKRGKFDKDRVVPVTRSALFWLTEFPGGWSDYFFSGMSGEKISQSGLRRSFRFALEKAGIHKKGLTIHSIRHTCATHLLENGAGVRYVQELLGHGSIETTVKYTRQLPESMKKNYRQYHPRENLLFKDVDEAYRKRIDKLKMRIMKRRKKVK